MPVGLEDQLAQHVRKESMEKEVWERLQQYLEGENPEDANR